MLRISPSLCGGSSAAEDEVFLISAVLSDIGIEVDDHSVIRRLVTIVRPNDAGQALRACGVQYNEDATEQLPAPAWFQLG